MSLHLAVLLSYSAALMALGVWIGQRVRGADDFFVAGRRLGPGLIFSTMLAANIGAGSTVGAAGLGYADGLSAWWWVGSAAAGTALLAFLVGPAIRREAATHQLKTVGDYLELRYGRTVRAIIAGLVWVGSIAMLGGELVALAWVLNVVAGLPMTVGCILGGAVMTVYFTAGGLLTSAWVNVVQLTVKLGGFAVALPLAIAGAGGWANLGHVQANDPAFWTFWRGGPPGLMDLALLTPAFIVSPGLLQKVFGARDDRAVRVGVGLNAFALLLYAAVPVLFGLVGRARFPSLAARDLTLPTILVHGVPPLVGAIGLAAVFSAEVSAADAVLFMLTTSLAQDLYKRFLNPTASDSHLLGVTRATAILSGALGIVLAIAAGSVIGALTIFYTLITVSLFVPVLAGLYVRRATSADALAAIAGGVGGMLVAQAAGGARGWGGITPALAGLMAATVAWALSLAGRRLACTFIHGERYRTIHP